MNTKKPETMNYSEVHAILDKARFGDTLTVVRTNGSHTSTVSGPVLGGDPSLSPIIKINILNGEPYVVREYSGDIYGEFLHVELRKGDETTDKPCDACAKHTDACATCREAH